MMTTIHPSVLEHFGPEFRGYPLSLSVLSDRQWLIVLQAHPSCRLRLSAESDLTKELDRLGLSDEVKLGDSVLDEAYLVRAETPEARDLLTRSELRGLILQLHPFVEMELTYKEYRLIKDIPDASPESIEAILGPLSQLVDATSRPPASSEA